MDFSNDLASLSMSVIIVRYVVAPRRVKATVIDSLVGLGITSNTVAIAPDARIYLETLVHGKSKRRHLRAMMYLDISMKEFANKLMRAR